MQTTSWYIHRLRAMSPRELGWRVVSTLRDQVDRVRFAVGAYPSARRTRGLAEALTVPAAPQLCDLAVGAWRDLADGEPEVQWRRLLIARADRIVRHRLRVFGREYALSSPIDWNRDVAHDRHTPLRFAGAIDYRDFNVAGDAKIVWEPNRHQHFLVLARAYRVTGDRVYAAAVLEQLASWLDQCPFGHGMNWRSPLELAIRLINWTFALDLIRDSGTLTLDLGARILHAIDLHVWEIARKYSRGSSANNHLIGEAAAVFVATSYFRGLPGAERRRANSFGILCREIEAQTYPDGGTREQAMAYHLFVLELLLVSALVGRATGLEFPGAFWSRLEAMFDFAATFSEAGPLSAFGDSDDGYVLDFGERPGDPRALYCVGAVLFRRSDLRARAGEFREPARWLLGAQSQAAFEAVPLIAPQALRSRAFPDSGYYILQGGGPDPETGISAVFDCGALGFTSLAAHGHADALSLVIRAFGREILIDPGTFDYFSHPEWREYFRGTRAHNTVTVDGVDQSVQLGGFLWGAPAHAECLEWTVSDAGVRVVGQHDGYRRLPDPVLHRRTVELDAECRALTIQDDLSSVGMHDVEVNFHLADGCRAVRVVDNQFHIYVQRNIACITLDDRLTVQLLQSSEQPITGWVSHGYHEKRPTTTIRGSIRIVGDVSLQCRIEFARPNGNRLNH